MSYFSFGFNSKVRYGKVKDYIDTEFYSTFIA